MVSVKKLLISITSIIILVIIGIFFYWKNLQRELISLNQSLPEGIKITKTLMGRYEINNKIDNYKFKAPKSWKGINDIEYMPNGEELGYTASSLNIERKNGDNRIVAIDKFKSKSNNNLKIQANNIFSSFELTNNLISGKVNNLLVEISRNNPDLMGMDVYFFRKGLFIYGITSGSPENIEEIITNGTW